MYTPIHAARLYQQIVQQIEARILNGELKPGDRLSPERELAEQFGVSRTAVREAVKALIQAGLVEAHPGRGTFVISNSPGGMRDLLEMMLKIDNKEGTRSLVEVREILEPEIAALAAARASDEQLASLLAATQIMEKSLEDIDAFIEADMEFHQVLAEGTRNPLIMILIDSLVEYLQESRKRIALVDGGMRRAQEHHRLILEAILRRDANAAREAMRQHLQQVGIDSEASLHLEG